MFRRCGRESGVLRINFHSTGSVIAGSALVAATTPAPSGFAQRHRPDHDRWAIAWTTEATAGTSTGRIRWNWACRGSRRHEIYGAHSPGAMSSTDQLWGHRCLPLPTASGATRGSTSSPAPHRCRLGAEGVWSSSDSSELQHFRYFVLHLGHLDGARTVDIGLEGMGFGLRWRRLDRSARAA
jgi:hypothetical protein